METIRFSKMDTDKIYYLQFETFKRNTAAFKAPDDIYQICEKNGFHKVAMPGYPLKKGKLYGKIWLLTVGLWSWISLGRKVPKGSFVLFQHPESGKRLVLKLSEIKIHAVAVGDPCQSVGIDGIVQLRIFSSDPGKRVEIIIEECKRESQDNPQENGKYPYPRIGRDHGIYILVKKHDQKNRNRDHLFMIYLPYIQAV